MHFSKLRKICSNKYLNPKHLGWASNFSTKAEAAAVELEILHKQDPEVSRISTGITVASVENYSPISKISFIVKAGPCFESPENSGIAHMLRNCATLGTKNNSAFLLTRTLEWNGANLSVTGTREHLIYTLRCARDNIEPNIGLLADIVSNPAFKPWEVKDVAPKLSLDRALHETNPTEVVLEALHKAAYRGPLSNSMYANSFMIGKYTPEMLHDYVKTHFTTTKTSIVGVSVPHEQLESLANQMQLKSSKIGTGISKFTTGEIRMESDLPFVHTAIVAEGAGVLNTKEELCLGVLQCILGLGTHISNSSAKFWKLGEAAAKSTNNAFHVSALNLSYENTGLFGVHIVGHPGDMNSLVKAIISQMKSCSKAITDEAVKTAKHKLKASLLVNRESSDDLITAMAQEASYFGKVKDIKETCSMIDKLTTSDVQTVASKVSKAKPAMASLGRLHSTPFLDELL